MTTNGIHYRLSSAHTAGEEKMGFSANWPIFQRPEIKLEKLLENNKYHPFERVCSNNTPVYIYARRLKRFYLLSLLCIASFIFVIVWATVGGDKEYLVFAIAVLVLSCYLSLEFYSIRTIVLDPETKHYSVYRGSMLTATEHCHNIYVRLHCKRTGSRYPVYYLVLDGYAFEAQIDLARDTTNKKKLRHLAHQIAQNLQINYFDIHTSSKHHIIRHYKPHIGYPKETAHEE